ncbi:Uncharacterised protein [Mycobacterium tuberculosis]|uniref:Uncharacterized protein n=1 Tax=Mycobacterium tuberculosis TaxID=1773 RepID=A0A916LA17_MYCTX|nr:Uncharacterised protein [Mycobacterium tuberculosis]COW09225.1 Uncharacterised protein [Mycobacterium tuberculosis]COW41705.1 Uncharacterised protein [Mycobacterium tuberculosis]COX01950.1 Uncharacterised protein [Mycobacterium tuberculosis]COX67057.1 Uncharacterised protein [Mycobacterium tuberculosis]
MKRSRRPSRAHPDRLENDKLAECSSATEETDSRCGRAPSTDANAPRPRAAHHRRCSAGALTTPTDGTPSSSSAIKLAHTGTPRTKFLVPSIGSTIHCRPVKVVDPPNSSPKTPSPGRSRPSVWRTSDSTARSASVTGVKSGLVSMRRSSAPNRTRVNSSARSARASASIRSSWLTGAPSFRRACTQCDFSRAFLH